MKILGRFLIGMMAWMALSHGLATSGWGMDLPSTLTLNSLSQYYDGVEFDHAMHLDVESDCAVCHHHTTGAAVQNSRCAKCHHGGEMQAKVACRDCHVKEPYSAKNLEVQKGDIQRYHNDQLGLKGAYHQSCLGCHQKMDAPTGCQDCHSRNESGNALSRSGKFAPKTSAAAKGH